MHRTILVADESSTIRRIVELTFGDTDLRVETVATAREALERLPALEPDLVLVDVALREPSGYELCRAVKASPHPAPVLLLTGAFDPFDREKAEAAGADGHLVKPFESSVLRIRVAELLAAPVRLRPQAAPPVPPEAEPQADAVVDSTATVPGPATDEDAPALPPAAWLDAVAREVVARLSRDAVSAIAREIVPTLARELIEERIRELERRGDDD